MDSEEYDKFFETYGTWEDEEGKTHRRRVVVIDEKPNLIRETLIDNYTITRLTEMIKEVAEDRPVYDREDYSKVILEAEEIKRAVVAIADQRQGDTQQRI